MLPESQVADCAIEKIIAFVGGLIKEKHTKQLTCANHSVVCFMNK